MQRGLWNTDNASFFSEATLIEIGVYTSQLFLRRILSGQRQQASAI